MGHFQPTKKTVGTPIKDVKGKGRAAAEVGKAARASLPTTNATQKGVDASVDTMQARPQQTFTAQQTSARSTHIPEALTPSPSRSSPAPALLATPSSSRLSSASPPPELLQATHKSPVSVREDPDKGKFYLMISSPKKKGASASPSQLQMPTRTPFHLREGSPSLDRTPMREAPALTRQPPSAPKKRHADESTLERLRVQNDESPLPHDKRRPSYKAFGASQEAGLSLIGMTHSGDESFSHSRKSKRPRYDDGQLLSTGSASSSDDELLITPRKVREQPPKGVSPAPFATPSKAAKFDDPFSSTPRIKPTRSAGIFSSLIKPTSVGEPRPATSSDEDNPFLDSSPAASSSSVFAATESNLASGIPEVGYGISSALPLPPHYNSLYLLHTGIEHALVVHLATTGLASSSIDSTFTDSMGQSVVRLPNLITYTALRPLVERTAGRRLGPVELARLMYLWSNGRLPSQDASRGASNAPVTPVGKEQEALSGLGFILARQRCLDANGRRKWDWSLGIELTIKRARREVTPPLQVSFGGSSENGGASVQVPSTPPSSARSSGVAFGLETPPSTPSGSKRRRETSGDGSPNVGREGMSLVALWNNGIEERKSEVGRRLRALCASDMEEWLQNGATTNSRADLDERPSTPEPSTRRAEVGAGGLLTPSATRPEGRRSRFVKFDKDTLGGEDAVPLVETEGEGELQDWKLPAEGELLSEWHPRFSLKEVKAVPCAILPNLKDVADVPHLIGGSRSRETAREPVPVASEAATPPTASSSTAAATPSRAQSLMDRIKAKEESKRSSLQARAGLNFPSSGSSPASASGIAPSTSDMMASFKRRATLSRLNDVATSLHMLFVTSSETASPLSPGNGSGPLRRSPILPLSTVLTSLSKSSRVTLSTAEARGCIDLLAQVCPGFLDVRTVGGREWVKMGESGEVGLGEVRRRVKAELEK